MRRVCVVKCNIGGGGESTLFATQSFISGALFGKVQRVVEPRRRREGTFYSARPPSGPAAGETRRRRLHAFDLLCHLPSTMSTMSSVLLSTMSTTRTGSR